jgi:hypothetical protein
MDLRVDEKIMCVRIITEIDESALSEETWHCGAVYRSSNDSVNPSKIQIYATWLTIGKEYRVKSIINNDTICVINDTDSERFYLKALFETKAEQRQKKLEEIGI